MRRLVITIMLLLLIPAPAFAGGGGGSSLCPGFATGTSISMLDSCFAGTAHFAPTETAITVRNDGFVPHTFTAVDGSFDSGQVQPGETFELTVEEPGVYEVFCSLHGTASGDGMAGVLLVGEAEPGPVSAQLNLDAIRQAVAEETAPLTERMQSQATLIGALSTAQARLSESVENQAATLAEAPSPPPVVRAEGTDADLNWVFVTAGVAAGLALAALATNLSTRRRPGAAPETWQPSLET